jgi:hypothetical protein
MAIEIHHKFTCDLDEIKVNICMKIVFDTVKHLQAEQRHGALCLTPMLQREPRAPLTTTALLKA